MSGNLGKKVYQYDLDGNFIAEHKNAVEAGFSLNAHNGANIYQNCLGNQRTYKGYIWTNKFYIKIPQKKLIEILSYNLEKYDKPIYQYDFKGNFVAEYKNLNDTSLEYNIDAVRRSLNKPKNSACNYFWSFIKYDKYPEEFINSYVKYVIDKPFYHYDLNGNFIKEYKDINDIKNKTKKAQIKLILRGVHHKNSDGFWSYTKYKKYPAELMNINKRKIVIQFDKQNNKIATYESTLEAEKKTGVCCSNISQVCNGKQKTAGGFIWKYKDNV